MIKHWGLKRYYHRLALNDDISKDSALDFADPETWPYCHHWHFDNWGYGNNSFKRRKPHLDKLFRHFDILVERTKETKAEFQLYAILLDNNSRSDALFLHEIYPENNHFQFKVSDLRSTSTLTNQSLNNYIDQLSGYEKQYGNADEAFCLLYRKDAGTEF